MRRLSIFFIVGIIIIFFVLWAPTLRTVHLESGGKVTATAKRSFAMPWRDSEYSVYSKNSKLFCLWGDFFDQPLFLYTFEDGKRFLCIDDDDTSVLVFVVDFQDLTNKSSSFGWPPDDYTRNYLVYRATNVVYGTKGFVRLPSFAEVQEVSSNLLQYSPKELKVASFPVWDLGIYRTYWPKKGLLSELETNRHSVWP